MKKSFAKVLCVSLTLILVVFLVSCSKPSSSDKASNSPEVSSSLSPSASDSDNADASASDTDGSDESASASPDESSSTSPDESSSASPDESSSVSPDESSSVSPSASSSPSPSESSSPSPSSTSTSSKYPKVEPDKTSVASGETVNFKITTSENVDKIQTIIDGSSGKTYTDYTTGNGVRNWKAKIVFTTKGSRKVQFKCTMASGSTVLIPKSAITIKVTDAS